MKANRMIHRLGVGLLMSALLAYTGCERSSKERLHAQPSMTADEVFEFRADKTSEYRSYSATVVHTQHLPLKLVTWQEKLLWKAPDLSRSELAGRGGTAGLTELEVRDSNAVSWTELTTPKKRWAVKVVRDTNQPSFQVHALRMEINPLLERTGYRWNKGDVEYTVLPPEVIDGQRMHVLESVPSAPPARPQFPDDLTRRNRLYIGEQDGFIHKIEVFSEKMAGLYQYDPKEPLERTEWRDLQLNVEFPGELFAYQPPPGVPFTERAFKDNAPVNDPVVELPPITSDFGPLAADAVSLDDQTRWDAQQKLYTTKDKNVLPILLRSLDVEAKRTEVKLAKIERSRMLGRGIHLPTSRMISYLKELGGKDMVPYFIRFQTKYPRYVYEIDHTIFEMEHDTSKPINTDRLQLSIHPEISGSEGGRVSLSYSISSRETNGPPFYAYAFQILVDGRVVQNSGKPHVWPRVMRGKLHNIPVKTSADGSHTVTLSIVDTDVSSSTRFRVASQ